MPPSNSSLWLALLIAVGTSVYLVSRYYRSPWRMLPPGPKGVPILGNAMQLGKRQWLTFTAWKQTYGDIIYLNAFGQPLIILNSHKVAADLLDRRATKTSGRPGNYVAELLTGNLVIVFIGYTNVWRRMRKAVHEGFNKSAVHRYHPVQYEEAVHLTYGLLSTPDEWDKHLRRSSASSVMALVYGTEPIASEQDPRVKRVNDHVTRLARASLPGAHLVQFIPLMRYLPRSIAQWKRNAQDWHERDSVMFGDLFESVRQRMARGEGHATLAASLIEDVGRNNLSTKENAWLAGTMYAAGAETTSAAMSWFMFAIVLHPEVQKRAQAELDAVVGHSRPPSFSDYEDLSYIRALAREVLRWHTVDPVGLPHRTTEDDWYNGHFIPKGALLVPNVWHLNRDPDIYGPDADQFNPSRHLDKDGKLLPGLADTKEESHVSYGFGRRICVGRHIANNALFINISLMLWAMNIERGTDEKGELLPMDVDGCVEEGLVVRPLPFQCKITPRFPEAQEIIARERETLRPSGSLL